MKVRDKRRRPAKLVSFAAKHEFFLAWAGPRTRPFFLSYAATFRLAFTQWQIDSALPPTASAVNAIITSSKTPVFTTARPRGP